MNSGLSHSSSRPQLPDAITPAPAAKPQTDATPARPRLDSIDLLRGLVMVVMVLDHTRDFLGTSAMNPRDVTDSALFLTRWMTHFCAPVFVFLAGVSAFLYGTRGRSKRELSRFLLTRGIWLVIIELTVIRFAAKFSLTLDFFVLQVIWAIGCSMIALAALVYLPRLAIGGFALALIGGHNLLDGIKPESFGSAGWVWHLLHAPAMLHPFPGTEILALYPLIPWIGVLAAGYVFGPVMLRSATERRRIAVTLGIASIALFAILRTTGLYGDPAPRVSYEALMPTLLSFLNCEKYPPSLLYLTMTLGPALIALGLIEQVRGKLAQTIVVFGRVPMLYYVAHLFVLHTLACVYALYTDGTAAWLIGGNVFAAKPPGYGFGLPGVYAIWISVVVALYPACRWFAALKQRRRDWWLSYL
jgi:uncharacterized membrane protein